MSPMQTATSAILTRGSSVFWSLPHWWIISPTCAVVVIAKRYSGRLRCITMSPMNPSHVDTVFIGGKVKKWRGNLVGVDTARVLGLVEEARDGVVRRAGFQMNLLG